MSLDVGIFPLELLEIGILLGIDSLLCLSGILTGTGGIHGHDKIESLHNFLGRHRLFLATAESVLGRFEDQVGIEGIEEAGLEGVGDILTISPREGIGLVFEFGNLGGTIVAGRCQQKHCRQGGDD